MEIREPALPPRLSNSILVLLSALLLMLLFTGGGTADGGGEPRSWEAVWNLGHVATFFIWTLTLQHFFHWPEGHTFSVQWKKLLALSLLAATLIEGIQYVIGRNASVADIATSAVGSFAALAFFSPVASALPRARRRAVRLTAAALLLLTLLPLLLALLDEALARHQFPMLDDFETPLELSRWDSRAPLAISDKQARHGRHSLQVRFTTERYSTVGLRYFPRDWRAYQWLRFSVYNPGRRALMLSLRIHDREHVRQGMPYQDRFNGHLAVHPGWNDYRIPLARIRQAPRGREMDLGAVAELAFFVTRQPRLTTLYFDALRLE